MTTENTNETVTYVQYATLSGGGRAGKRKNWSRPVIAPAVDTNMRLADENIVGVKFFEVSGADNQLAVALAAVEPAVDTMSLHLDAVPKQNVQSFDVVNHALVPAANEPSGSAGIRNNPGAQSLSDTQTYVQYSSLSGGGRNGKIENWSRPIKAHAGNNAPASVTSDTLRVRFFDVADKDNQIALAKAAVGPYVDQMGKDVAAVPKHNEKEFLVADAVLTPSEFLAKKDPSLAGVSAIDYSTIRSHLFQQVARDVKPVIAVSKGALFIQHTNPEEAKFCAAGARATALSAQTTVVERHPKYIAPK